VDLAGHFQVALVDRVVPALDVDGAGVLGQAEQGDQVGPVGIAKAGVAVVDGGVAAAEAVGFDQVPVDRGVFAVDVEDPALGQPLPQLGERVDQ